MLLLIASLGECANNDEAKVNVARAIAEMAENDVFYEYDAAQTLQITNVLMQCMNNDDA